MSITDVGVLTPAEFRYSQISKLTNLVKFHEELNDDIKKWSLMLN